MKPAKPLTALQELTQQKFESDCLKYPNVPAYGVPKKKFTDTKANGLSNCIITRLKMDGWQAERINRIGRPLDNRKEITDVLGHKRVIGSIQFIKSGGQNGTADISATINGRSVKIEIKIGKDRQSADQSQYQQAVEKAGGVYIIASSYANFLEQYQRIISK